MDEKNRNDPGKGENMGTQNKCLGSTKFRLIPQLSKILQKKGKKKNSILLSSKPLYIKNYINCYYILKLMDLLHKYLPKAYLALYRKSLPIPGLKFYFLFVS